MHGIVESWLARGQQRPADASPDAGRIQQPTHEIREPVGTPPTGEHAEAEAQAIRAAAAAGRPARIAGGFAVGGAVPVDSDEDRYAQADADRVRMTAAWERASAEADRLRKDFGELWAERNELASENAQLKGRVVELELTVKALGTVVAHAAGHGEGSESDG